MYARSASATSNSTLTSIVPSSLTLSLRVRRRFGTHGRVLRTVELLGIQEIRLGRARGRGVRDRQRGRRALEAGGVIATAAALEGRGGGFAFGGDGRASPTPRWQPPGEGCQRDDAGGAVVAGRGRGVPHPACADDGGGGGGGGYRAPFSPAPRSPDPRPPAPPSAGVRGWTRDGRSREGEEAAAPPRDGRVVPAVIAPRPLLVGSHDG